MGIEKGKISFRDKGFRSTILTSMFFSICSIFFNAALIKCPGNMKKGYRGETWPRSSQSSTRGPETDMFRSGIKPGPPLWVASTLAKSFRTVCKAFETTTWARDSIVVFNRWNKMGSPFILDSTVCNVYLLIVLPGKGCTNYSYPI